MTQFQLAKDVVGDAVIKMLCEMHWERKGVANAIRVTCWFVEFIPGFGFRISPEPPPPWTRDTLEEQDPTDDAFEDDDEVYDATVYHDA